MDRKRAVFGAALVVCMLAGCSQEIATEKDGTMLETEDFVQDDCIVVGYAQVGSESDWRNANTQSFKETFTEENGYYLIYEDGQQKQENQVKAIRNFILQEVDYIVLDPIVETGWDAVLAEAKEAGIPVILSDRMVEVEDESLYTCWVGSDFKAEGRNAGKWLEDYLAESGRDQGTVNIVTLQGTPESSAQIGRTEGFAEVMKQHENWVMLDVASGDFTQAKAQEVMADFLKRHEQIDVVVSENDNMTFGAILASREAGRKIDPEDGMIMLSFDAVADSFESMERGEIAADFECNPMLAPLVDEVIRQLERGGEVEKIQYVDETYYDFRMDLSEIQKERKY